MRTLQITDPDDARIEAYRSVQERDLVGRQGRFIVEGEVVLRTAVLNGRFALESVLLAERRVEALSDVLERLPADVAVYVAAQPVLDAIVGFHIHRGVLAIGRRGEAHSADALMSGLPERAVVVALFGLGNHDNVGGVFRNAAAFGVDAVLLDPACCDPLYRKAIRVSVGGALVTPFARLGEGEDPLTLFARHALTPIALSPRGDTPLHRLAPPARAALMLGAEGPGLPETLMAGAQTVSIPMAGRFDSLNVAVTSGIALHQLRFGGG